MKEEQSIKVGALVVTRYPHLDESDKYGYIEEVVESIQGFRVRLLSSSYLVTHWFEDQGIKWRFLDDN